MLVYPPGYRRRRATNWLIAGTMYAFFYMARYNFSVVNARLADLFGWTNTQIGIVTSIATLVYGASVFLNGPLADRIGGRRAILIGAAGSATFNILFGLGHLFLERAATWTGEGPSRQLAEPAVLRFGLSSSTLVAVFAVLWAINFYFQSFGALSIVKINAAWFHVRERGTFSGIFGILIRFGLLLAFEGVPRILGKLPWQWVFWVPAVCLLTLFAASLVVVKNTPKDAGFEFDTGDDTSGEVAGASILATVVKKVLANPVTWTIALGSMMLGLVRRSVVDEWWPKYFANVHGADPKHLNDFLPYLVSARGIFVAGILGGILFGIVSDRVYAGRRAPTIVIGFVGMAVLLVTFGLLDRSGAGPFAAASCIIGLSFFVNGAHGLIGGAASMDFGGKKAAATAAGLFDGMQYIASSLVGVGMGKLLDAYGWGVWQFAPIPFAVIGALLMLRLWNVAPGARHHGAPAAAAGAPTSKAAA